MTSAVTGQVRANGYQHRGSRSRANELPSRAILCLRLGPVDRAPGPEPNDAFLWRCLQACDQSHKLTFQTRQHTALPVGVVASASVTRADTTCEPRFQGLFFFASLLE